MTDVDVSEDKGAGAEPVTYVVTRPFGDGDRFYVEGDVIVSSEHPGPRIAHLSARGIIFDPNRSDDPRPFEVSIETAEKLSHVAGAAEAAEKWREYAETMRSLRDAQDNPGVVEPSAEGVSDVSTARDAALAEAMKDA